MSGGKGRMEERGEQKRNGEEINGDGRRIEENIREEERRKGKRKAKKRRE